MEEDHSAGPNLRLSLPEAPHHVPPTQQHPPPQGTQRERHSWDLQQLQQPQVQQGSAGPAPHSTNPAFSSVTHAPASAPDHLRSPFLVSYTPTSNTVRALGQLRLGQSSDQLVYTDPGSLLGSSSATTELQRSPQYSLQGSTPPASQEMSVISTAPSAVYETAVAHGSSSQLSLSNAQLQALMASQIQLLQGSADQRQVQHVMLPTGQVYAIAQQPQLQQMQMVVLGSSQAPPSAVQFTAATSYPAVPEAPAPPLQTGTASLYVKNLPPDFTELMLYQRFAPFGALLSCKVMRDAQGRCRGCGFVNYVHHEDALKAMRHLDGMTLPDGSQISVVVQERRVFRYPVPASHSAPSHQVPANFAQGSLQVPTRVPQAQVTLAPGPQGNARRLSSSSPSARPTSQQPGP